MLKMENIKVGSIITGTIIAQDVDRKGEKYKAAWVVVGIQFSRLGEVELEVAGTSGFWENPIDHINKNWVKPGYFDMVQDIEVHN